MEMKPGTSGWTDEPGDNQPKIFAPAPDNRAAYVSTLDGATLLNVPGEAGNGTQDWTLIRYSYLRPNVLHLELLNDDYGGGAASPAELRAALQDPVAAAKAYEDFLYCVRVRLKK